MTDTKEMRSTFEAELARFAYPYPPERREDGTYRDCAIQALWNVLQAAWTRKPAEQVAGVGLTVWEGAMPESNGKSNFTAVLHRKESKGFDLFTDGFQFARSEYQDRVRYEADFMRWMIGECEVEPELWDECYDMDKHSGYKAPAPEPVSVPVKWEDRISDEDYDSRWKIYPDEMTEQAHKALRNELADWRALAAARGWVK